MRNWYIFEWRSKIDVFKKLNQVCRRWSREVLEAGGYVRKLM